jgi:hypothetical protein
MNNKKIITEVERIKELMVVNEQLSKLIPKLFADGARVTSMIGTNLMSTLRTNIDNLVTTINTEGKFLPSIGNSETIPEYMVRIANDTKISDDVLNKVYRLFPDLSASFDTFAKPQMVNDILSDQSLMTDIAKTMNRTQLNDYLRNTLKLTDDVNINKVLDEVNTIRAKMPVITVQTVKVKGLKKWFIKPTTVQYTNVTQAVDNSIKDVLGNSAYSTYFKGIDSSKPIQEYTDRLIKDIQLEISNGSLKDEAQVTNYILENIKEQYKEIQGLPKVKAWYDKILPTLPKTKVINGIIVKPGLTDWLAFNAKLGIPAGVLALAEMLTTYDSRMNLCVTKKAGSESAYSRATTAQQVIWTNSCTTEFRAELLYGVGFSTIGGPLSYIALQLWDKFKVDHNISDNKPLVLNTDLLKPNSNTVTTTYVDDLPSFKKYMDDQKIPNSGSAIERKPEAGDVTFKTYIGNTLTYKFCKGNFIASNSECK